MLMFQRGRILAVAIVIIATQFMGIGQPLAQAQPVSILIVRHAETDTSQPTLPLTAAGRERGKLLGETLQGIKFTHVFASHTTRAPWSKSSADHTQISDM